MQELLSVINAKMEAASINYQYGEYEADTVTYPYFVGEMSETDYTYEDGHTAGTLLLDGFCRTDYSALVQAVDAIRDAFKDCSGVSNNIAYHLRYGGCQTVGDDDPDLYHMVITIFTQEWKGEE